MPFAQKAGRGLLIWFVGVRSISGEAQRSASWFSGVYFVSAKTPQGLLLRLDLLGLRLRGLRWSLLHGRLQLLPRLAGLIGLGPCRRQFKVAVKVLQKCVVIALLDVDVRQD